MDSQDYISIKEHLITILNERTRNLENRLDAMDTALKLSKHEMDRRLAELNNLRSEVTTDREDYVRKELCDKNEGDTSRWREDVNDRLTTIEAKIITWTLALGAFYAIMIVLLKIFKVL